MTGPLTNNGALNGAGGGVVATTSSPTGVTFVDAGGVDELMVSAGDGLSVHVVLADET